jgi:hypothetical protein
MSAALVLASVIMAAARAPAPSPSPPDPAFAEGTRRLVLLPLVGVQQHAGGDSAAYFGTDLRAGGMVGWRFIPAFSIELEVLFDRTRPQRPLAAVDAWTRQLALVPLFHWWRDSVELFIGPKLGLWLNSDQVLSWRATLADPERGWTSGADAGLIVHTRFGLGFGVLLGIELRSAWNVSDSEEILGFSGATLF